MAFLDAHALGYEGTLKLSAESKAERVSAHLDHVSKGAQPQMQACGESGHRAGSRAYAASRSCTPPATPWLNVSLWKKQEYSPT